MGRGYRVDWDVWDKFVGEMNDVELAEEIGCARSTVTMRRRRLGIKRYFAPIDADEVRELRKQYSQRDVAYILGCARSTIHYAERR